MIDTDEDYNEEKQCIYKDETYLVRDNGAVLRLPKSPNKVRPLDNKWTFGSQGDKGYSYIAGVQVHRIVATAFHGEAPSSQHIVDHIDTNRQNNRPENLHWVTKLENVLNNPITRKRVIAICGSIEAFLKNPSLLGESALDKNFSWMRRVTAEEAKVSRERLEEWAKSDTPSSGGILGQWIYENRAFTSKQNGKNLPNEYCNDYIEKNYTEPEFIDSLTTGAKQKYDGWKTPTEFPCVPQDGEEKTLDNYLKKLKSGSVFSKNQYMESIIDKAAFINKDRNALIVKTYSSSETNVKPGGCNSKITLENGYFIHESLGSYFDPDGAEKYFRLAIGEEWTGGDVFDDFC